ncbi:MULTISPECIES: ABC transporter ATP-binding protein [Lysinibacillus]|uniref:ABC transporter ATP-binding protein n=1 Tax=Lysinibacillus TaxID=400634 RepID=UPI00214B5602|nr:MULTISPECIES: ABC transporter ATP-binding protein [Lysinibacillus]UNT55995.1 ABC transporter ATP-binding protein [Lysinibacillus capsici]UUV24186.1 ABC transporter ATP-binding protein/permease [Lysinibacillus sp. FN11]UYB47060.1 ABC transporter ATP-binding protein/permease [Lysinibacillus capsici]
MNKNSERKNSKTLSGKVFLKLIKEANPPKWIIFFAIVLGIIETVVGLLVPLFTMKLVDQLASSAFNFSFMLLFGIILIMQTVSSGLSFYFMTYIGESIVASIRNRLWRHVLRLPISFFDDRQSGEILSRITQDTNIVKALITQHLITFVTGIITIIGSIIFLLLIDWKMTVIMLISIPLSILFILPLGQKMYKIANATQDEMANFSANLGRVLANIRLVKAYHAEKTEGKYGEKNVHNLFKFGLKEARVQAFVSPFMTFVMMLVLVILIGYGGVQVASGALTAGALVAIIIYMFQITVPFTQMASFFTSLQKALGAVERIRDILFVQHEGEGEHTKIEVQSAEQNISFYNVSFAYQEDMIIKNLSLTIPTGKMTAFVGPSGSGKTTLFSLLERFYKPISGEILLGQTSIYDISLQSWRSQLGYVSQESPLMSGTIKANILYGVEHGVSETAIQHAIQQANAWEFIDRLPDGVNTQVGEGGMKLSGGQRQRIAIARALIRNPKILLLDEATSNLDSDSELLVQKALQKLMADRTTLVIAHRLSTILDAHQIVVLERGEITGIGTHKDLMQTHMFYEKLVRQQLKNED